MSRLVLWDIDGTLLRAGTAGRDALVGAVAAALGQEPAAVLGREDVAGHPMGGKTDPQIVRELLVLAGAAPAEVEDRLEHALDGVVRLLAEAEHRIAGEGRVLPGVREVLERLAAEDAVVSGVLTGNLRANALIKLRALGLDAVLDLAASAFGSDSADRRDLVPLARDRAAAVHGTEWADEEVWVVGDTPRDLACARAGGVRCLLVATGSHPFEELREAGADVALPDLADAGGVVDLLLNG